MNLKAKVKQKNNQLMLRNVALEEQLYARVNAPEFGSFLVTFIAAPLIFGAIAHHALGSRKSAPPKLYRAALAGWRLWSLL